MSKERKKRITIFCIIGILFVSLWAPFNIYFLDNFNNQGNSEFLNNGLHQRFFIFKRNLKFDIKVTPVQNMMLVLQSLDSFSLCEEDWLQDMQFSVAALKEQYNINKYSLDPGVQELMGLQLIVIQKMDVLIKDADSSNVVELQQAFQDYVTYYEEHIIRRGDLNELGEEV